MVPATSEDTCGPRGIEGAAQRRARILQIERRARDTMLKKLRPNGTYEPLSPEYIMHDSRLQTFDENWTGKISPDMLAVAGFMYCGERDLDADSSSKSSRARFTIT